MRQRSMTRATISSFCLLILLAWGTLSAVSARAAVAAKAALWHGLTVSPRGVLEKHGQPYRGIGVNFVGALRRLLANPDDPSVPHAFKELQTYHIPFVRFPALAIWGSGSFSFPEFRPI